MEVKICPRCKKPVEANDYPWDFTVMWGGLSPKFRCRRCGFRGPPIILSDEE